MVSGEILGSLSFFWYSAISFLAVGSFATPGILRSRSISSLRDATPALSLFAGTAEETAAPHVGCFFLGCFHAGCALSSASTTTAA